MFLTSDGIADNFDPFIRQQASAGTVGEGSNRPLGINALSPATCHAMAVAEMAAVFKDACRQQQQPQEGSHEAPAADVLLHYVANDKGPQAPPSTEGAGGSSKDRPTLPLAPIDATSLTAKSAVNSLIAFVRQATAEQRTVLEDSKRKESMTADQLADLVASLPGKMDHASVVAYKVGAGPGKRGGSSSSSGWRRRGK